MTPSQSRHQSSPQTTLSEDLIMTSPISPPDPTYPCLSDFPSPAESDALQTPYFTHYPVVKYPDAFTHPTIDDNDNDNDNDNDHGHGSLGLSGLPPPTSPPRQRKDEDDYLAIPGMYPSPPPHAVDHYASPCYSHNFNDPTLHSVAAPEYAATGEVEPSLHAACSIDASLYSPHFPSGHRLNAEFLCSYQLGDELGSGGYGFVMIARHRAEYHEVAVKFIIKKKVPEHAWVEDEAIGRLPTEVMLLSCLDHDNIVKCLDLFEDSLYFYLVQELHGSPWPKYRQHRGPVPSTRSSSRSIVLSTPSLSPSVSTTSLNNSRDSSSAMPLTPPDYCAPLPEDHSSSGLLADTPTIPQREYFRRPSHDLFECIEQSENKRLSETQARYVFSQIVDVVHYLDSNGIAHRDIKDENIVIDRNLNVKLIDFGSASIVDPNEPRPYYTLFFGTTAYASPEILLKKEYQAAPAEIWTLGVLLSYLLTGTSPFPTIRDAVNGRIILADVARNRLSRSATSLMKRCLDPDPRTRATIAEVKAHRWLR